jgi:hypothetical protein
VVALERDNGPQFRHWLFGEHFGTSFAVELPIDDRGGFSRMKKALFLMLLLTAFSLPAFAGSFYVLGSYNRVEGESDVFDQNRFETDFETDDLDDFGFTAGYDAFLSEYISLGGSVSFFEADTRVRDTEFEFDDGSPIRRRS